MTMVVVANIIQKVIFTKYFANSIADAELPEKETLKNVKVNENYL